MTTAQRRQGPLCRCGAKCAYYGAIGGYSKSCTACNAKNAERQRIARRLARQAKGKRFILKDNVDGITAYPVAVVFADAYDAATARAEQAEADVKERDEIILETHRRVEQAEVDNAALVDACRKVFSITIDSVNTIRQWDAALCELDELSKQTHPGSHLLELAQIVEKCDVCSKKLNSQRG